MNSTTKTAGLITLLLTAVTAPAAEPLLRVESKTGQLAVTADGVSLATSIPTCPASVATGEPFWSIVLEPAAGNAAQSEVVLESRTQSAPAIARLPDGGKLAYQTLTDGKTQFNVGLSLTFTQASDRFKISAEIANRTAEWVVKTFSGPVFNGIQADLTKTPLLLPAGFGWRINAPPGDGKATKPWSQQGGRVMVSVTYPSAGGTMQWLAFAGESAGLYFGSHDPGFGAKALTVRYDQKRKTLAAAIQHQCFVQPGETQSLPPLVVMPYAGDWHVAARAYRAWVDSVEKPIEKPEWAKTASGWLLAILKQQNGDIMWPYPTLGQLADVAEARGLDILGLFGWGYGGHDHLYPDYDPCPLMGGQKALREGIRQAHARGKRVILYANGQLIERGTAYWTTTGQHLAVTRRDGGTVQEFWHKYRNTPGYHFDIGCQTAQGWHDRLLALARQANDLGADGILYDQLGVRGPTACYAPNHGHPVPIMSYEADRKQMLRNIAQTMRKTNPDFVIMTEGFHDAILDSVCYFHGCVRGTFQESADLIAKRLAGPQSDDLFPEMMRYTYPEAASTIRFPSPLVDRPMANYTVAFGLRFEIESRYLPDRDYLIDGRIPSIEGYGEVISKPNITLVRSLPAKETAEYLRRAATFQKKNAALLMTGTFTDTEGFSFRGPGIVAKGFRAGDLLGVLLWNTTDKPAGFTLDVPQHRVISATEPEREQADALAELAAQSLRLVVWKRN